MSSGPETLEQFLARGGQIRTAPPARATNHDPQFGKKVAAIRRAADPNWLSKKERKRLGLPPRRRTRRKERASRRPPNP